MMNAIRLLGLLTLTASVTLLPEMAAAQQRPLGGAALEPRPIRRLRILDLAAHRIEFRVLQRTSRFAGLVRISGVVRNVGSQAFQSSPRQAAACLFENDRLVARVPLERLAAGRELRVAITRNWSQSNEFPPTFKLRIVYGPDIRLDGNPHNDDRRRSNDATSRSGHDMQRSWDRVRYLPVQARGLRSLPRQARHPRVPGRRP